MFRIDFPLSDIFKKNLSCRMYLLSHDLCGYIRVEFRVSPDNFAVNLNFINKNNAYRICADMCPLSAIGH